MQKHRWAVLLATIAVGLLFLLLLLGLLLPNHQTERPKKRPGRLARLLMKYRESLLCMAHIIDGSMMGEDDPTMTCCRYDSFNMWLMDKQTEFCPKLDSDQELAHIFEKLTPSMYDQCTRVNTDTFSCQMMLLMMNGPR